MRKSLAILALAYMGLAAACSAQEKLNTLEVDINTYRLYERGEWKPLIRYGRAARRQGYDYYYLQYRMGISYYELRRFRKAIPEFERVVSQNPMDSTASEYLYYSYLLSGMTADARVLGHDFGTGMKKKLQIDSRSLLINGAGTEYKYFGMDDFTVSHVESDTSLAQKVRIKLNYGNFSLSHAFGKRFTLFHSFSFLWGLNRIFDPELDNYPVDENLKQYQYYICGNVHAAKGLDITAAFHYVRTVFEGLNPDYGRGPGSGNRNIRYLYISKFNSTAAFLKVSKSLSCFNLRISGTLTDLNGGLQYQPAAGLDYYPLGNTDLYVSGDATYLVAPDEDRYTPGIVVKGKLGIRITGPIWLEPFAQYGKVSNYADEDAFIIYNSHDVINYWYGARLNILINNQKVNLYYIYQQYSNTNYYHLAGIPGEKEYSISSHLLGLRFTL